MCSDTTSSNSRPGPQDIICGRGSHSKDHPGNQYLKSIIEDRLADYDKTPLFPLKKVIIDNAMKAIEMQETPGRFLKYNKSKKAWVELDEQKAFKKTYELFRVLSAKKKQQQQQQQQGQQQTFARKSSSPAQRSHSMPRATDSGDDDMSTKPTCISRQRSHSLPDLAPPFAAGPGDGYEHYDDFHPPKEPKLFSASTTIDCDPLPLDQGNDITLDDLLSVGLLEYDDNKHCTRGKAA